LQESKQNLNHHFPAIVARKSFDKTMRVEAFSKKADVWSLKSSV